MKETRLTFIISQVLEFFTAILDTEETPVFRPRIAISAAIFFQCWPKIRLAKQKLKTLSVAYYRRRPKIKPVSYSHWLRAELGENHCWESKVPIEKSSFGYGILFSPILKRLSKKTMNFCGIWIGISWQFCLKPSWLTCQDGYCLMTWAFQLKFSRYKTHYKPFSPFSERDIYTAQAYFQLFGQTFES